MPSPPDDYDRRRRSPSARYYADADEDEYPPPRRSNRRDGGRPKYDDLDTRRAPHSTAPDAPSALRSEAGIEPNMKASRRDRHGPAESDEFDYPRKGDDRGDMRSKKPARSEFLDDDLDRHARHAPKSRTYDDDDDGYRGPKRSNTVREDGRRERRDRDRDDRRGGRDDKYTSSYDDLSRPARRGTTGGDYDDRDRGYRSDGRDHRKKRDPYDDDYDRGYRSGGGRRDDPYDDRDRHRRGGDRDRDRDRGYRSDGRDERDDYRSSRPYDSDRGGNRRDRDRDRDRYDNRRDRYDDRRDRYDDRDRGDKKKGFSLDAKNIPGYIEKGKKYYASAKPLVDRLTEMYLKK